MFFSIKKKTQNKTKTKTNPQQNQKTPPNTK